MKREYPDRPIAGAGAVIIDRGRVLLVRREHAPSVGEWSIPGGAVELGETVREAVIREVREETGLVVIPNNILGVFDRIIRDARQKILYHYLLIDFLCVLSSGELAAATDCTEAKWFSSEDLRGISLLSDTAEVVHLGFKKAGMTG